MTPTEEVGGLAGTGGATAVNIDASTGFTLPTTAQRKTKAGQMKVNFSIEVQSARFRWDGTAPTAGTGVLLPPGFYTITGENLISNIRLISAVAGSILNYQFSYGTIA